MTPTPIAAIRGGGRATLSLLAAATSIATAQGVSGVPEGASYTQMIVPVDAIVGHLVEGPFQEPRGVFFEPAARELYVTDMKNSLVGIFDEKGIPLFTFGGRRLLVDPKVVRATESGEIYVLDAAGGEIKSFTYRGEPREAVRFVAPDRDTSDADFRIVDFALDSDGNWYVVDGRSPPRVLVYDAQGELVLTIPREDDVGSFELITGIAVSADGYIAVTDHKATPVQIFDSEGRFVSGFGERDIGLENFTAPIDAAFDNEGYLFVVDMLRHDVKIFDLEGRFQGFFGGWFSPQTRGRGPGEMLYPTGIAIAPGKRIFVAERFGQRVQIFERRPREDPAGRREEEQVPGEGADR